MPTLACPAITTFLHQQLQLPVDKLLTAGGVLQITGCAQHNPLKNACPPVICPVLACHLLMAMTAICPQLQLSDNPTWAH